MIFVNLSRSTRPVSSTADSPTREVGGRSDPGGIYTKEREATVATEGAGSWSAEPEREGEEEEGGKIGIAVKMLFVVVVGEGVGNEIRGEVCKCPERAE